MRNEFFIEGQISIFELPIIEVAKPKENIIKEEQNIKEAQRLNVVEYLIKANFSLPEVVEKIRAVLAS